MFSKSRFFLALILLGPWVRASGGAPPEGINPYWTHCTEASQVIGLLSSRKFHVYRPTNDVDFEDLELRQRRGERAAISFDHFVLSPEPVEFSGDREWSLVAGGVGHLLANNYETLLKCVNSATRTAAEWRPRGDLLQLARFQNDLLMAVHALESPTNAAAESLQRRSKTTRASVLIRALDDLLAKCLLTEDEVSRLPDTGDLGVISADQRRDDDLIYVGLRGVPTQHEEISFHCIYNETRVHTVSDNLHDFHPKRVLLWAWPGLLERTTLIPFGLVRCRFRRAAIDPLDPAFRLVREAVEKNEVTGRLRWLTIRRCNPGQRRGKRAGM